MATKKPAAKKAEEAPVVVEEQPVPLPGTPVDAVVPEADYVPLGVARPDLEAPTDEPGSDADVGVLLEGSPSETTVHDTTVGSARPEDGA